MKCPECNNTGKVWVDLGIIAFTENCKKCITTTTLSDGMNDIYNSFLKLNEENKSLRVLIGGE